MGEKRAGGQVAAPAPIALAGQTAPAHPTVPGRQGGHRGIGQGLPQVQVKNEQISANRTIFGIFLTTLFFLRVYVL